MNIKKLKIDCPSCRKNTNHESVAEHRVDEINDEEYEDKVTKIYQIVRCKGCDIVSYIEYKECLNIDGEFDIKTFPERSIKDILIKEFSLTVPEKIKTMYTETVKSYNKGIRILCAAGVRATIEGICNNLKVKGGNLEEKINALKENGILSNKYAETLHELRFMGNEALHKLDTPEDDELKVAIDILEHTIVAIYEIDRKKDEIISRRKRQIKNE